MQMNFIDAKVAPLKSTGQVKLYAKEDFEAMRVVGRMAAQTLDALSDFIQPGVTTQSLDDKAVEIMTDLGAVPAPLNYRGFRRSICTSINHVVCHGIPGDRVLRDGDIMNVDVTLYHGGFHGDHSRMYGLGDVSVKARRLMDVTYDAMMQGIEVVRPGATLGDIGAAIQSHAEGQRLSVVRDFGGHGLGVIFHDAPNILHYGRSGEGLELREGMMFTIEPMLNLGKPAVKILGDGWTAVTRDRTLSAQFEHSIGVTATGFEIFTASLNGRETPHKT